MALIHRKNPGLKLIYSSDKKECSLGGEGAIIAAGGDNDRLKFSLLDGKNRNKASEYYSGDEKSWLERLKLAKPPFFLRKYLRNEEQEILIYQQSIVNLDPRDAKHEQLQEVLVIKSWMKRFDDLYHYSALQGAQGVLFMISQGQNDFFIAFEELFSYFSPHIDMYGEKSYWYLPTDHNAYDQFIDLSEMIEQELEQFLWREQTVDGLIKQYLRSRNL